MKRLTTLFLVLLLAGQAWGADLHVKELAESAPNYVQYRASATGCDDAGEWTAATDLEAAKKQKSLGDGVTEDYAAREALISEIVARMGAGANERSGQDVGVLKGFARECR